jgi:hypothetical protein
MRTGLFVCSLALGLALAGPTVAQQDNFQKSIDTYPGIAEHAKLIREGKIVLTARPSLDEENGRFHIVHVDEIDMECTSCHIGAGFAADYQLVDKDHAIQKAGGAGKGKQAEVIDRTVCLGCHKTGGIASRWYGTVGD